MQMHSATWKGVAAAAAAAAVAKAVAVAVAAVAVAVVVVVMKQPHSCRSICHQLVVAIMTEQGHRHPFS